MRGDKNFTAFGRRIALIGEESYELLEGRYKRVFHISDWAEGADISGV